MRNFLISIFILVIPLENLFSNNWIEDIYQKFQKKYIVSASFYYNSSNESDLFSFSSKTHKDYYLVDIFNSRVIHSRVLEYLYLNNLNLNLIGPLNKEMMDYPYKNLQLINKLDEMITIHNPNNTDIYRIDLTVDEPDDEAILLLNLYLDVVSEYLFGGKQKILNEQIEFLNKQIDRVLVELKESELKCIDFQEKNGIYADDSSSHKSLELYELKQSVQNRQKVYLMLKQKLDEAIITRESSKTKINILDEPRFIN